MPSCSVIMVTYHTGPILFISVANALRQQQLAELIVVNNGNPPDVYARLQQMALTEPRLKILTGHGNVGFAKACNLAAAQAAGEFLLLLAPDCLLPPEALADTVHALADTEGAILAGCRLENSDGSEWHGNRHELLTPKTALLQALGGRRLRRLLRPEAPVVEVQEVPAVSGAFMCLRREHYRMLSGMDEQFFLHAAALDFCMRIHRNGGKVIFVPPVRVTHMPGIGAFSRFTQWQKTKGLMRYFDKHFRGKTVPGVVPLIKCALIARFIGLTVIGFLSRLARRGPAMAHSVTDKRLMILASGVAELPETKAFHGKTVLVTGATSQTGLCVLRRLLASGAAVLAISRGDAIPFRHERLRWIKGDLTDQALHLQGYLVDIAVHCAPLWHLPPTIGMLANAEVKRIIAFGSTSVFAKALSNNMFEKDMVDKLQRAEREIAALCNERDMHWTVLRPTMIYGVGLDLSVTSLAKFIRRFGFFPVYPPAFGRRQPVHADDLAQAVLQMIGSEASFRKIYNISGGEIVTYREMLERLFRLCWKKPRIPETTLLPFALDLAGWLFRKKHLNGEVAHRMNDDLIFFHDEATRDFGFMPRPFLSGGMRDIEGF